VSAAAFFDLDRTLLSRSSALALARPFRARGLIDRRALLRAALWQLFFSLRGDSTGAATRAAERGLRVLRGLTPEELRTLVAGALEAELRPLVYAEPLALVARHRERGEMVYVVSATIEEIVETIAVDLGFDGGIGSICELGADGTYTGRAIRILHAHEKAAAVRELGAREGFDLGSCTAYSDSYTDLPFLEAVGTAVAVNPDRALRRVARERGWQVLDFRERAYRVA
jgi:HAD superfamily hydrolase (TIGR01490 family)